MATRKRTTRTSKRSNAGKGSLRPALVLGAIVAFGAFSVWASTNHKRPQTALNELWKQSSAAISQNLADMQLALPAEPKLAESRPSDDRTAETKPAEQKPSETVKPAGPVKMEPPAAKPARPTQPSLRAETIPRPAVNIRPAERKVMDAKAEQETLLAALIAPHRPTQRSEAGAKPTQQKPNALLNAPRGKNSVDHSPTAVFAREELIIRKTAWDNAPAIGMVGKGREMRSYGKTGRWHRVVVPSTNMIGWVHEDKLTGGTNKRDSASLVTGSVAKPVRQAHGPVQNQAQKPVQNQARPQPIIATRPQPPMPVGPAQ